MVRASPNSLNEYNFANHQHLDAGAFQIYYRGALAIDSGLYSGSSGEYGSPHCRNYYWRTIAHNSLLVYDPREQFSRRGDYGNDGGQRLPNGRSEPRTLAVLQAPENGYRTGAVLAHGFGPDPQAPDYTLLQGDITEAYSRKVKQVTRSFVFLNLRDQQVPAALVVLDRVASADPAFQKYWLLHCLEEPKVGASTAVVDCTLHGARGPLNLDVLLPSADNLTLSKVGGPGKEFWVFGTNYENNVEPTRLERSSMEPGAWRLEVSPRQAAAEDLILNVMQVTDRESGARWPVSKMETEGRTGCLIAGPASSWLVLLRRDATRSSQEVQFRVSGPNPCRALVTDLTPGHWRAERAGAAGAFDVEVTAEAGAARLEAEAGAWILRRGAAIRFIVPRIL